MLSRIIVRACTNVAKRIRMTAKPQKQMTSIYARNYRIHDMAEHNRPHTSQTAHLLFARRQIHSFRTLLSQMETQNRPNKLRFDLSAEDIAKLADQLMEQSKKRLDQIAAVTEPTWENCIQALADEEAEFATLSSMCTFPSQVSASKEIRDASTEATKKLEAYSIERELRPDVYKVLSKYKAKNEVLEGENKRLFAKIVESFERNGLGLAEDKQKELKEIKTKLADLCIEFQKNLIEDTTALPFSKEELDGLPEDFFEGLKSEHGKYLVSLKYPEIFPVLQKAKRAETRRLMDIAREGQCQSVNVPLFEQVLQLRQREAELLGYESHAHFILAIRMAKTPEQVMTFLNELKNKLEQPLAAELARLLDLKRAECKSRGEECDEEIHSWDWRYYQNLLLEKEYTVDDEVIKEYFPLEHVTQGLLDIYQGLLGLVFKPTAHPHVWHSDVTQYDVLDADTKQFMGHFYLDLFPRDGKYTHAAEFDLMKHCVYGSGEEQFPAAAMVANFTKPQNNKPSLLKHDEVVTYFHEFGHVMHELCSKSRYYRMSGTNTERDFVECPSQILENWCFEEQVLNKISKHYKSGEPLPRDLIQKIIAAKNVGQAMFNRRQLFFGLFDMFVHTSRAVVNTNEHWPRLKKELMKIDCPPNANGAGSFGHLVGGYSAGYYGYLWSEVFAADMFRCWKKSPAGVFDPALGRKYRNVVLARGGTVDGGDMLREFLGREPSQEAFLVHIGLVKENETH